MRIAVRAAQAALIVLLAVLVVGVWRGARAPRPDRGSGSEGGTGSADLVLGPTGIGKLRLGMSEQQASSTGEARVSPDWKSADTSTCYIQTVNGVTIHFSRHHGLAVLSGPERTHTPEGVRAGASVAEVAAAYPTVNHPDLGTPAEQVRLVGNFSAPVPTNPDAIYVFIFRLGGTAPDTAKLQLILLSLRDQGQECTHAD
jgi:hypothetical protein